MAKYIKHDWKNEGEDKAIPLSADNLKEIEDGVELAVNGLASSNLKNLVVQRINTTCTWIAPKAVENKFKVICVGGGGGGGNCCYINDVYSYGAGGGGGGYVSINEVEIEPGTSVQIVCGAGGTPGNAGGSTSFDKLSAKGGQPGGNGTIDGEIVCGNGGDGGSGGGGGSCFIDTWSSTRVTIGSGGNGDLFGGGGCGSADVSYGNTIESYVSAGRGGTMGGAGGAPDVSPQKGKISEYSFIDCFFDINALIMIQSPSPGDGSGGINSNGGAGSSGYGGGGGYCGNGGAGNFGGGGGGGYCGNGGAGSNDKKNGGVNGGGGGGFFCDGADGMSNWPNSYGGGGGGFFCDGKGANGGDGGVLIMYIKEEE